MVWRLLLVTISLLAASARPAAAAIASDFRKDFYNAAVEFEDAATRVWKAAAGRIRGENQVRRRNLAELREYSCRARLLAEAAADDRTKTRAFRELARLDDLAGYVAADLPRSVPFFDLRPLALRAQAALDKVNRAAALYFGAFQPDAEAFRFADEAAEKATKIIDEVRATTGHSGRRHNLIVALEEFAAHARAYAAALGDPLVTEPCRRERLCLLFRHADCVDLAIVQFHANDYVRARWNEVHDNLRMVRWRFDVRS